MPSSPRRSSPRPLRSRTGPCHRCPLLIRICDAVCVVCVAPSVTVTTSVYAPSVVVRESQTVRAVQVSGSVDCGAPVAVPTWVTVPSAFVIAHVTVPTPSPLRPSTLSATEPLNDPDDGCTLRSTGLEVVAAHVALAVWACAVAGPDASTGTMLYV